jgi:NAD-reducing hydrogenase large subunit
MGQKITIEPVTRVEGHGKVTIHLNNEGKVTQTRLHIVEFRGFERFVQGRPYWEAPVLVERLCGICPVSHHLAAAKALDVIVGAGTGEGLTPTGEKMRRLMHYGQIFQSHSLHFFHLASPDLLFGIDADPLKRNIIALALENKDLAVQGVMMRKFGQEIIAATAGKKIHGTGAIPGGINKHLSPEDKERFLNGKAPLNVDTMIDWSQAALEFFHDYHEKNKKVIDEFIEFPSSYLSLVRKDGALDLYHGVLRAKDSNGKIILHDIDYQDYLKYIDEEVRPWSYMKFPYLKEFGKKEGWYSKNKLCHKPMHAHWARLIEILHSAEKIKELLNDTDLMEGELTVKGKKKLEGVGLIEAPRGTLFHHYKINDRDQIVMCNLIVSTTNNNQPMNEAVNQVAVKMMTGQDEISEAMMNAVEVAIRAYDPCLSCATHALGQMPLEVSLFKGDQLIHQKRSR